MNTIFMTKETRYSNRQIEDFLQDIKDTLTQDRKENKIAHDAILEQVKYTNGKVAEVVKWRERVIGMAFISVLFIIPMLTAFFGWMTLEVLNFEETLTEALSVYETP